jgi:hypothetical protein
MKDIPAGETWGGMPGAADPPLAEGDTAWLARMATAGRGEE